MSSLHQQGIAAHCGIGRPSRVDHLGSGVGFGRSTMVQHAQDAVTGEELSPGVELDGVQSHPVDVTSGEPSPTSMELLGEGETPFPYR